MSDSHPGNQASRRRMVRAAVFAAAFAPAAAFGSNTSKPIAPASFLSNTCMVTVDRETSPEHTFEIGIPFEDVGMTADEAPGSRRMQFFATCRDRLPREAMPTWITRADALATAIVDPSVISPPPDDVLEESPAWNGPGHGGNGTPCVIPINAADDRMPVTCEATADGITWDTTDVPPGAYVIWGYTYEGVRSVWRRRPGIVRVTSGSSTPPAVAFSSPAAEGQMSEGTGLMLQGCAAGRPDASLTLSWSTLAALAKEPVAAWTEIDQVAAGGFEVPFAPPEAARYEAIVFRAQVDDTSGTAFVFYADQHVTALPGCEAPSGGIAAVADACDVADGPPEAVPPVAARACTNSSDDHDGGDTNGSDGIEPDAAETETETGNGMDADAACIDCDVGCACAARRPATPPISVGLLAWIVLELRRRRRRDEPALGEGLRQGVQAAVVRWDPATGASIECADFCRYHRRGHAGVRSGGIAVAGSDHRGPEGSDRHRAAHRRDRRGRARGRVHARSRCHPGAACGRVASRPTPDLGGVR